MIPNGSFIYPQLPFNSAANFSQFYPENFHGICPAEGLPIYQLAGMNGHSFMSNCPSYISAPSASYLSPTAATANAYTAAPYQNAPTGYIYSPGIATGPAQSIQLQPSQHSLAFQSQQAAAGQHLLPTGSIANTFQYPPGACAPQTAANSNQAALHAMGRYSLPSNHPHSSSSQTSQVSNQ